jgi:hypothetical protein
MATRTDPSAIPDQSTSVGEALISYYRTHGLPPDGGATDRWFRVHIGPLAIPLPNPPARRRAVLRHDINHLATGYNTTFSEGEMSIGAFEVGAGCGRVWIAWYLNLSLFALGLFVQPIGVFAAFRRGRRSASIYHGTHDTAALSAMTVADVRTRLGLDAVGGAAQPAERLAFAAWAVVALLTLLAPWLAIVAIGWAAQHTMAR